MREKGRVMRKRLQETQRRMPPQSPMPLLLPSSSAWRLGVTGVTILLLEISTGLGKIKNLREGFMV